MTVEGAHLHNLRGVDLRLPERGFVAVTGPSGSGKSSLVFGVLGASVRLGRPVGCTATEGFERFTLVETTGSGSQTVIDALGLLPSLQTLFQKVDGHGLPKRAFSFRSSAGYCPSCRGTGVETVSMDALADLVLPCAQCQGTRFRPEVRAVKWRGLSIDAVLAMPAAELLERLEPGRFIDGVRVMNAMGLGHIALGRRTRTLSGGERQRLGMAVHLRSRSGPAIHLLDEPARGLHGADIANLVARLGELSRRGDLVVATVHRRALIRAADHVIELGPGAGEAGGRLLYSGIPR